MASRSSPISPPAPLRSVAEKLKRKRFEPGDHVFREGEPATDLLIVESGRVHVWGAGEGQLLASLGPGSILGEIALLLDVPRTATVRAVTACSMLALSRKSLEQLIERYPSISSELTRELGRRLRSTSRHVTRNRTQQIVAVWGAGAHQLARAVRREQKLAPAIVTLPGSPDAHHSASAAVGADAGDVRTIASTDVDFQAMVLHGLRPEDFTLLFVSLGRRPSPQARTALDVADQIVVFEPAPDWVRERAGERPLIEADTPARLERAVRWVTGRSVGLVLSSGGSRALAHIGVVNVLRERDIPIDAVSGSSGGALIAGAVAAGVPSETLIGYAKEMQRLTKLRRMDFNVRTRGSLLKGQRIHRAIERWSDGRTFADLDIPLYIVATDLLTGEEVTITSGSVADAVRASMSIPGVIDPFEVDGRVLTDGAVVDPLPASALRAAGLHRLVASNVAGLGMVKEDIAVVRSLGLFAMMNRVTALREQQIIERQSDLIDAMIRPRAYAANALDFGQIEQFVAAGEAAARLQLPLFEEKLLGSKNLPTLHPRHR